METARYWEAMDSGMIRCGLCPHACRLAEGATGRCRVRTVQGGRLRAVSYGTISSSHVDPIEKKPLFHFYPGEAVFSVGSWGCNFSCSFCQNWSISQEGCPASGDVTRPEDVVARAQSAGGIGIAYTYNEPLVSYEFVSDCAALARDAGLKNVLVTNGYVCADPAAELLPLIDALNIDVKCIDDAFYAKHCGGHVRPVLDFATQAVAGGCHVEITNLIIPGLNDDSALIESLAAWIATSLGRCTPLHLSAYHPQYRLGVPATPRLQLERARDQALKHLSYVYLGNTSSALGRDTVCPSCGNALVTREGYDTRIAGIEMGMCTECRRPVDVVTRDRPLRPT